MNNIQENVEEWKKKKKPSSRADIIKRMVNAYRKRKRKEKIDKLQNRSDLWKGLEEYALATTSNRSFMLYISNTFPQKVPYRQSITNFYWVLHY